MERVVGASTVAVAGPVGTWGMEAGVATPVVSEMLGHSSTRVTENTFQHVRATMHQRAAEILDQVIDGPEETNGKYLDRGVIGSNE